MKYIKGFDTNILVIVFFPGLDLKNKRMIQNSSSKVVVLMTYGSGNIPMSDKIMKLIKSKLKRGRYF